MSDLSLVDQLEVGIEALHAGDDSVQPACDPEIAGLLSLVSQLRTIPREDFKARLQADLMEAAEDIGGLAADAVEILTSGNTGDHGRILETVSRRNALAMRYNAAAKDVEDVPFDLLPTLSGGGEYPVRRGSFIASLAAHAAALALIVTSGIWAAGRGETRPQVNSVVVTDISYVLPPASTESRGGGGGGDQDKLKVSKGNPPRFAREQIAPPTIVVRTERPKLPAEPTVIGPPNLSFPQTSQLGDPLSGVLGPLSNGTGSEGGMGSGDRGGVGPGRGPGVGPGWGGGFGGGPYVVGGGVMAPRAIYSPEPEYSEEARRVKYQAVAVLQVVVDAQGRPRDIRVARSAGMGLDEKAMEAVRQWRFEPGTKDGRPVAVVVNVEVNFRLY